MTQPNDGFLFPPKLLSSVAKQQPKQTEHCPTSLSTYKHKQGEHSSNIKIVLPQMLKQWHFTWESLHMFSWGFRTCSPKDLPGMPSNSYLSKSGTKTRAFFGQPCFGKKGKTRNDIWTIRWFTVIKNLTIHQSIFCHSLQHHIFSHLQQKFLHLSLQLPSRRQFATVILIQQGT